MEEISTLRNRQWIYDKRPSGQVGATHYRLVEAPLPKKSCDIGEVLILAKYISVDPYMRVQQAESRTWEDPHPTGTVQQAGVVGKIIAANDPTNIFKVGDFVQAYI